MKDLYMGIDGGTTGIRVGIYERDGHELGFASTPYETSHLHAGWAEQRPDDWWEALKKSAGGAFRAADVAPERIAALAADTTSCSVMACLRDGTPLRDCLIWMDVRAAEESDEINEITGEELSPEWMPAKLLWLKRHEPEIYRRAEVFCEYQDWLMFRLTGRWCININNSVNWGYNSEKGGFDLGFYKKIGLEDAPPRFPADTVYAVGDPMGRLDAAAARELGLCPDTLAACGGIDSSIGILGMGVYETGKLALVTGSSNLAMVLTENPVFNLGGVNIGPNHLLRGCYTDYRGQTAAGSILGRFKREMCRDIPEKDVYRIMDAQAEKIPVGSDGLLVLDYFQGNRHPYLDGEVRGMIYGLSLNHTRAHIYRALIEGICFGTAHLLKQFADAGRPISEITVAGGFSNSRLLLGILSDVCGVPVNVPRDPQSSCLGSGICAAAAAGAYPGLREAAKGMTGKRFRVEPNPENTERYKKLFSKYLEIYPTFSGFFHDCARVFKEL